ncbi:MAG: hypothetical protein IKZ56_05795, partial [Bacteroidales bacterium]|nr:hypothetical protein [Bacteroidales bacterium]
QFLIKCCLPSLHVLFAADFSKVSARNQQGDSKGAAREQQGDSKKILGQGVFSARTRMRSCACAGMEPSASRRRVTSAA